MGLDTAVFTAVNGMLIRARVEKDPESFVELVHQYSGKFEEPWGYTFSASVEDYRAYQSHAHSLDNLAIWTSVHATMGDSPSADWISSFPVISFRYTGWHVPSSGDSFVTTNAPLPAPPPWSVTTCSVAVMCPG